MTTSTNRAIIRSPRVSLDTICTRWPNAATDPSPTVIRVPDASSRSEDKYFVTSKNRAGFVDLYNGDGGHIIGRVVTTNWHDGPRHKLEIYHETLDAPVVLTRAPVAMEDVGWGTELTIKIPDLDDTIEAYELVVDQLNYDFDVVAECVKIDGICEAALKVEIPLDESERHGLALATWNLYLKVQSVVGRMCHSDKLVALGSEPEDFVEEDVPTADELAHALDLDPMFDTGEMEILTGV